MAVVDPVTVKKDKGVTLSTIHEVLQRLGGYHSVYVPEFTWGSHRIDAAVIDLETKWVRGFEIKMSHADFIKDEKAAFYTQFVSSFSYVCPQGVIQKDEVEKPFGLLWIKDGFSWGAEWVRKPKPLQKRAGLAWMWTYLKVVERELPRLDIENQRLRAELTYATKESARLAEAKSKLRKRCLEILRADMTKDAADRAIKEIESEW
jgi:hypothetical protein